MEQIGTNRTLANEYLACCLNLTVDIFDYRVGSYVCDGSDYSRRVAVLALEFEKRV